MEHPQHLSATMTPEYRSHNHERVSMRGAFKNILSIGTNEWEIRDGHVLSILGKEKLREDVSVGVSLHREWRQTISIMQKKSIKLLRRQQLQWKCSTACQA